MAVEPKSSRVHSLVIAVTFALIVPGLTVVDGFVWDTPFGSAGSPDYPDSTTTAPSAERSCSLESGGTLTLFNGERAEVRVPCKYRLADFTCGDYRVKVAPGSSVDAQARFSHDKTWVKVVNTVTMETVKLRTSLRLLEKVEAGKEEKVWKKKEGNTDFLDFVGYADGVARVEQDGVFSLQFSRDSVQVFCAAESFSSPGVPRTLCGDGFTVNEMEKAKTAAFGDKDLSVTEYLQYIILNDSTVTQSKNCEAVASSFQGCGTKYEAHTDCKKYFNDPGLMQCLIRMGTAPEEAYDYCLRRNCYGDDSKKPAYLDFCAM